MAPSVQEAVFFPRSFLLRHPLSVKWSVQTLDVIFLCQPLARLQLYFCQVVFANNKDLQAPVQHFICGYYFLASL